MQRLLFILIALFFINFVQAQSCLLGGITFSSQEAVDSFPINYPGCTEIEGDVIVEEFVNNFNGLSQVTSISGNLRVVNNSTLLSMPGWDNLSHIGGDLDINQTWNLISLEGMEQLISIGGKLNVVNNFDLLNIDGLENLTTVGSDFNLKDNRLLNSISSLSSLTSLGGGIDINENQELTSTDGLQNVEILLGGFVVTNNDLLGSIVAMSNLTQINGDLSIGANRELTNIDGLAAVTEITGNFSLISNRNLAVTPINGSLESITGSFLISNNQALTNVNLLSNLIQVTGTNFEISGNPSLTNIIPLGNMVFQNGNLRIVGNSGLVNLGGLENIGPLLNLTIIGNSSLNSLTDMASLTSITSEVLFNNNLVLTSLEGLSNLSQIGGGLSILNNGCISLVGLEGLTDINKSLTIEHNDNLISLSGLINLTHIAENLVLDQNDNLPSLDGLQSLTEIPGYIFMRENQGLTNLTGLHNLTSVVAFFILRANNNLTTMEGLNSLNSCSGGFFIEENENLENLTGLESLTVTEGGPLEIKANPSLTSLQGLENLEIIRTGISILNNESLIDISALNHLSTIDGFLTFNANNALPNLSELSNFTTIGGSLTITFNENLLNLSDFSNLLSIGGGLFIRNNDLLENLTGLENISFVAGNVSITDNESLQSLAGLENIDTIGNHFFIFNNDALPNLSGINNLAYIGGNLDISRNDSLSNIVDLHNLTYIGDKLIIDLNNKLEQLDGLENLITVEDEVAIRNNANLSNIGGIQNIVFHDNSSLWIRNNPSLQVCSYTNICNHLQNFNSAFIDDNNSGCNSEEEILENCENNTSVNFLLFYDANQNGVMDNEEEAYLPASVLLSPNDQILYNSSILGGEVFLSDGTYSFTYNQAATPLFQLTTDSLSYQVEVANSVASIDSIYFGIFPSELFSEMNTTIVSQNFNCNTDVNINVIGKNTGTSINSGTLWLSLDNALLGYQPLETPDTTDALGRIGWHFENLIPGERIIKIISLSIPGSPDFTLGTNLIFSSEIIYNDTDGTEIGFNYEYEGVVDCSFNSNDKLVAPRFPEGYALLDEDLVYTVRFQNTGSAEALQVVIRDTLDSSLDPNTFRIIGSSHEEFLTTSLTDDQYLIFDFKDINLPDSTSNLEASQGYVIYSIKPFDGLPEETIIENTAGIYFDFNPPIITNTTENIMVSTFDADDDGFQIWNDCDDTEASINLDAIEIPNNGIDEDCDGEDLLVGIENNLGGLEVMVFPNPTTGVLTIEFSDEINGALSLIDITGKTILRQDLRQKNEINLGDFSNGVYLLSIKTKDGVWVERIVKIK